MGPPVILGWLRFDMPRLVAHPEVQPEPLSVIMSPLPCSIVRIPQVCSVPVVVLRLARRGDPLAGLRGGSVFLQ